MERPATWKVVTLGAALTGLSAAGAGAAQADSGSTGIAPASVNAASGFNAPLHPVDFTPWVPSPGHVFGSPWKSPWKAVGSPWKCVKSPWKCVPFV